MAEKKRPLRKPKDLRDAAAHVDYEIEMLAYSGEELAGGHSSPMVTPAGDKKNMALESFLLHFRNLRAFLCPSLQPVCIDDICASDFLDEPKERDLGDAKALSLDKQRLNKMLAHLSYSRNNYIRAGDHRWKTASMFTIAVEQMRGFLDLISEERRDWFRSTAKIKDYLSTARSLREMANSYPRAD
jgi:hypothetical protein